LFPATVDIIPSTKFWMSEQMLYKELVNWHYHNTIHLYSRCCLCSFVQI